MTTAIAPSTGSASTGPTPSSARGPLPALRIGWLRGKLEVREFFRNPMSVVFTLAFPVMLLLIFGSVFSYQIGDAANGTNMAFARYFVPGILASGLFSVAFQTLAIQIAIERDKGALKRLQGTPMPPSAYFIGKVIMVLTLVFLESALLLAVGGALGHVALPTDWQHWFTLLWVTLLGTTAGGLVGIAFSSLPRNGKAAPAMVTPIALILQFVSGVYFVFTSVSQPIQIVGALFPLKWIAQGYRSALLPQQMTQLEPAHTWEHGRMALILAAWSVGALLLALKTFRWRSRTDS